MQKITPNLWFDGNAKEAMEFYKNVFGGELTMSTFKEGMHDDSADAEKIMHAQLIAENGITLMGADTAHGWVYTQGTNVSISLSGDDEAELQGYWDKLSDGAKVDQPLTKAPWGDTFGMLTDKFSLRWLVNISGPKA